MSAGRGPHGDPVHHIYEYSRKLHPVRAHTVKRRVQGTVRGDAGEAETGAGENGESASGITDYGKSNADAELENMQAVYTAIQKVLPNSYHAFTYEDMRDMPGGSDGIVWKYNENTWSDKIHSYTWENQDGDFIYISFEVEKGEEWYSSCTYSSSVKAGVES